MTAPRFATQAIADVVLRLKPGDLGAYVAVRLKRSLPDAIGCALGALDAEPVPAAGARIGIDAGLHNLTVAFDGRESDRIVAPRPLPRR